MAEKTYKPILIESVRAQVDLEEQRFIGFDGNYCASGAKVLGVSDASTAQGQLVPVATHGILLVKTAGAITKGQLVQSDGEGYAITYSSGVTNCYALDDANGAGEVVRVIF